MPAPLPGALTVLPLRSLDEDQIRAVESLAAEASESDGIPPLSEAFRLALRTGSPRHLLAYAGSTLVGYAQQTLPDARDSAAELVVAPQSVSYTHLTLPTNREV